MEESIGTVETADAALAGTGLLGAAEMGLVPDLVPVGLAVTELGLGVTAAAAEAANTAGVTGTVPAADETAGLTVGIPPAGRAVAALGRLGLTVMRAVSLGGAALTTVVPDFLFGSGMTAADGASGFIGATEEGETGATGEAVAPPERIGLTTPGAPATLTGLMGVTGDPEETGETGVAETGLTATGKTGLTAEATTAPIAAPPAAAAAVVEIGATGLGTTDAGAVTTEGRDCVRRGGAMVDFSCESEGAGGGFTEEGSDGIFIAGVVETLEGAGTAVDCLRGGAVSIRVVGEESTAVVSVGLEKGTGGGGRAAVLFSGGRAGLVAFALDGTESVGGFPVNLEVITGGAPGVKPVGGFLGSGVVVAIEASGGTGLVGGLRAAAVRGAGALGAAGTEPVSGLLGKGVVVAMGTLGNVGTDPVDGLPAKGGTAVAGADGDDRTVVGGRSALATAPVGAFGTTGTFPVGGLRAEATIPVGGLSAGGWAASGNSAWAAGVAGTGPLTSKAAGKDAGVTGITAGRGGGTWIGADLEGRAGGVCRGWVTAA